jgi:hypothetical protein
MRLIADHLLGRHGWTRALLVLVTVAVLTRLLHGKWARSAKLAAGAALLYWSGLWAVYLTTPANLEHLLETSVYRVILTCQVTLLVSAYLVVVHAGSADKASTGLAR